MPHSKKQPDADSPEATDAEWAAVAIVQDDPDGLFNLAADVVALHGYNPAELFNVTETEGLYVVREATVDSAYARS